jgi:hypothetical protein
MLCGLLDVHMLTCGHLDILLGGTVLHDGRFGG